MTVRIPPRVNAALDWVSARLAGPVRAHPAAATVITVPAVVAGAGLVLPPTTAGYLTVSLLSVLAGAGATARTTRGRTARIAAERDDALREAGEQRHRATTAERQLANSVSTAKLPTIGGPL